MSDYVTVTADSSLENDTRLLVRLAIAEDLSDSVDWTSVCMVDDEQRGGCEIVPRESGVCAGLAILPWIVDEFEADLELEVLSDDGSALVPGQAIARLRGNVRDLLTSERTILNLLSRLCGVATQAKTYVDAIAGAKASVYDTRKTTPGWRLLEKYAVVCGGGRNHRRGLYDGFLIKDNHLQLGGTAGQPMSPREAVEKALKWRGGQVQRMTAPSIVEIEVDTLDQLRDVLSAGPDIVLIDNFSLDDIRAAVALRDQLNPNVELEVSGNVTIDTIAAIAATGVERISSGALTHQATSLDLGLDWYDAAAS
ncbi:carboxylating nicotinate-nucleotide diphosphorylase [Stieleria sp.]|uniref:carboxylating nicotinate-nucleotide diphosphorylase n=1 Tax=Stieleria sp. TaxID=2795976 RepID=UPI0035633D28